LLACRRFFFGWLAAIPFFASFCLSRLKAWKPPGLSICPAKPALLQWFPGKAGFLEWHGRKTIHAMLPERKSRDGPASQWGQFKRPEGVLWRYSPLLLLVLAAAFGFAVWGVLRPLPRRLEAVPVGILALAFLSGLYLWVRKRMLLRGLRARANTLSEKQAEQLLQVLSHSQHGYRDLIDSFDHAVFTISLDGRIRLLNRRFAEILGIAPAEVVNHFLEEYLSEPARNEATQGLPRFLEERSWSGVVRVRLRKTGEVRYFDCVLQGAGRGGRVEEISGLARDVTSQRVSEERFTQLFQSLQEGVYFSTPEGTLLDANPALVRMLGYSSRGELLAVNAVEHYANPADRRALAEAVEKHGAVHDLPLTLRRKDGSLIHCLDSCTGTRDEKGVVVRYQGTLVDITQRLLMERRLHQEQEFARRLIDCFPDAIVVLDRDERYIFVSPRIEELLGFTPLEFLGQPAGEHAEPGYKPRIKESIGALMSGKSSSEELEYRAVHKDGSPRVIRANGAPLLDAGGKIIGVVASIRDVTRSKQVEEQLLQTEKLAVVGQMIAGVAHELNNPLTAILGVSDLLRERATDAASRHQTELVQQQARRAANIVQSLLTFSRPSAAAQETIQLAELVQRALNLQQGSLRKYKIDVDLRAEPADLPPVRGDSGQLLQVFLNLIVNAEQAIRETRDHGLLRVRLGRAGNMLSISFEDDGAGVPRELLPRIFDPFFTTKRPGGGAGLGLTICLAIAKEHGGTIEALNAPGGGAVFRVLLPAASPAKPSEQPSALRSVASVPPSLRGHSVLVVDDEESIRELLESGLSARGLHVECVPSSEEALARLSARSYDAILCDFNLPGLSGEQFFHQLCARGGGAAPRFLFMTGDLLDASVLKTFERMGARIVQKPFQISQLAAILAEFFESVTTKAD
jgi:PAS domain S-box-containing protein